MTYFLELLKQAPLTVLCLILLFLSIRRIINGLAKRLNLELKEIKIDIKDIKENHLHHIEKDVAVIQEKLKS
jgi:hypothetical protein